MTDLNEWSCGDRVLFLASAKHRPSVALEPMFGEVVAIDHNNDRIQVWLDASRDKGFAPTQSMWWHYTHFVRVPEPSDD